MSRIIARLGGKNFNWCWDIEAAGGEIFKIPKPRSTKHMSKRVARMKIRKYNSQFNRYHSRFWKQGEPFALLNQDGWKGFLSIFGL